jgi:hypothetical protein
LISIRDFGTPTTRTMRKDSNKSTIGIKGASRARGRRRRRRRRRRKRTSIY